MTLRLDRCSHCDCVTYLAGYTRAAAIIALHDGRLSCRECERRVDGGRGDSDHTSCVVLYDDNEQVLDNRCVSRRA